ncbi:MAG: beta-hydroxyacyl-ACP dehydratase [Tepidisphaeraceae bacterium]
MKFYLLDKIESVSETRLIALKHVSLAEEYLADHFPTFPVLPGVLMLEALSQAAGWLLHLRREFARSMTILKEARNVKYGAFVPPGGILRVDVELAKLTDEGGSFKALASLDGKTAVSGRIEMAYFNLAAQQAELAAIDRNLIEHSRQRWALLTQKEITLQKE